MSTSNHAKRSLEERALLAPSFCAVLVWSAAYQYQSHAKSGMPFEECYLMLPLVLHRPSRESLPSKVTSSLPVWLLEDPLAKGRIARLSARLAPFTRDALLFGGLHDAFKINRLLVHANENWKKQVSRYASSATTEVDECIDKAAFVGRWFGRTGDRATVMALFGVRP